MKILVCGDSWTKGYDIDLNQSWPNFIDHEVTNTAKIGASNEEIVNQFLESYNDSFDAVIIGWSGVTRFHVDNQLVEFSVVDEKVTDYFKDKTLNDILGGWQQYQNIILSKSKVPVIQFSVFGDTPLIKSQNFLEKSYLEYLANKTGIFFKYDIPIFEFDWLNENNYKLLTKEFGHKFFPKNWERACIERENLRPGKYFLICGHPNANGHKIWAEYIKGKINDIFK
jgi:hypothetical protein